jgi:hypothetical protein
VAPRKKTKTFKIMAERNGAVNDFRGALEEKAGRMGLIVRTVIGLKLYFG